MVRSVKVYVCTDSCSFVGAIIFTFQCLLYNLVFQLKKKDKEERYCEIEREKLNLFA